MNKSSWLKKEREVGEHGTPGTRRHTKKILDVIKKNGNSDPDKSSTITLC